MMTSVVVDFLQRLLGDDGATGLAYIFFAATKTRGNGKVRISSRVC